MLSNKFSLVIHFMHKVSSIYISAPIFQFIPSPSLPLVSIVRLGEHFYKTFIKMECLIFHSVSVLCRTYWTLHVLLFILFFFLQRSSNSLCYGFSKWLHNAVLIWYSYVAGVASSTFQQMRVFRDG